MLFYFLPSSLQVYYAARDGNQITLCALLSGQTESDQRMLLSAKTDDFGQETTPLIIAAKNGHDKVIHALLEQYSPDLGQTGSVKIGNFMIEKASALWVAAGSGHLKIVKMLVHAGAEVNQA